MSQDRGERDEDGIRFRVVRTESRGGQQPRTPGEPRVVVPGFSGLEGNSSSARIKKSGLPRGPSDRISQTSGNSSAFDTTSAATSSIHIGSHPAQQIKIGHRFRLARRLGGGAFGEVYLAVDIINEELVALKLEPIATAHQPHLQHEARLYAYLNKITPCVGIPKLRWYGKEGEYNVLAMDFLGPSLEDLFQHCNSIFEPKTVCMIGIQIISRLEYLHTMSYLHRDIKPENFCMGTGRRSHHVYVIDLGLAKRFRDLRTHEHIPMIEGKALTGTARYVSVNTHLGYQQSRRDDIEATALLLIYFARGSLPWQGIRCGNKTEKYDKIKQLKMSVSLEKLCEGVPPCLGQLLQYSRSLSFEECPNYNKCRGMLSAFMEENHMAHDYKFCWLDKRRSAPTTTTDPAAPLSFTANNNNNMAARSKNVRAQGGDDVLLRSQQVGEGGGGGAPMAFSPAVVSKSTNNVAMLVASPHTRLLPTEKTHRTAAESDTGAVGVGLFSSPESPQGFIGARSGLASRDHTKTNVSIGGIGICGGGRESSPIMGGSALKGHQLSGNNLVDLMGDGSEDDEVLQHHHNHRHKLVAASSAAKQKNSSSSSSRSSGKQRKPPRTRQPTTTTVIPLHDSINKAGQEEPLVVVGGTAPPPPTNPLQQQKEEPQPQQQQQGQNKKGSWGEEMAEDPHVVMEVVPQTRSTAVDSFRL